jgi:hypothetical protein
MKRLAIAAVGLAAMVSITTGCRSSGYSQAEVEGTVAAAQTASADLLVTAPTGAPSPLPTSPPIKIPVTRPSATPIRNICANSTPGPYGLGYANEPYVPPPLYSPQEAVGLVRAALDHEGTCPADLPVPGWAAVFDCSARSWLIAGLCLQQERPVLDSIPSGPDYAAWRLYETDARVIPMTDAAAQLMQPIQP